DDQSTTQVLNPVGVSQDARQVFLPGNPADKSKNHFTRCSISISGAFIRIKTRAIDKFCCAQDASLQPRRQQLLASRRVDNNRTAPSVHELIPSASEHAAQRPPNRRRNCV